MRFRFRLMDEAYARTVLGWRYDAPYDVYDLFPDDLNNGLGWLLDRCNNYYSVIDEDDEPLAFCCFGADGQVPGGDYGAGALDIGLGIRPNLTGKGNGAMFVAAVLDFARATFAPDAFRVTVAQFNKRALRVWRKADFVQEQRFQRVDDGREFVVLQRDSDYL